MFLQNCSYKKNSVFWSMAVIIKQWISNFKNSLGESSFIIFKSIKIVLQNASSVVLGLWFCCGFPSDRFFSVVIAFLINLLTWMLFNSHDFLLTFFNGYHFFSLIQALLIITVRASCFIWYLCFLLNRRQVCHLRIINSYKIAKWFYEHHQSKNHYVSN